MAMARTAAFVSILACLAVATPVHRRQDSAASIAQYVQQVRSALYVVNSLQASNETGSCNDSSLAPALDNAGYNGEYAQQLLCEAAIGIQIFPDVDQAASDLTATLDALNSLDTQSSNVARIPSCETVNTNTLNEAGLDGPGIQDALCAAFDRLPGTAVTLSSTALSTSNRTTSQATVPLATGGLSASPTTFTFVLSSPEPATSLTAMTTSPPLASTSSVAPAANTSTSFVFNTAMLTETAVVAPAWPLGTGSANISSLAPSGTGVLQTVPIAISATSITALASQIGTAPSVIVVTAYDTIWVAPPVAFSSTPVPGQPTTTLTISTTSTETIRVTTTVMAGNLTGVYQPRPDRVDLGNGRDRGSLMDILGQNHILQLAARPTQQELHLLILHSGRRRLVRVGGKACLNTLPRVSICRKSSAVV